MKEMEQSKQVHEQKSYVLVKRSKIRVKIKAFWIAILDFIFEIFCMQVLHIGSDAWQVCFFGNYSFT